MTVPGTDWITSSDQSELANVLSKIVKLPAWAVLPKTRTMSVIKAAYRFIEVLPCLARVAVADSHRTRVSERVPYAFRTHPRTFLLEIRNATRYHEERTSAVEHPLIGDPR